MPGGADRPSIFLDANVLVAGARSSRGASRLILRLGELGVLDTVSCPFARAEAERALRDRLPAALPAFRLLVESACRWVDDPSPSEVASVARQAAAEDRPIFAAALRAGCPTIVTHNKRDFRPIKGTIAVETPGEFVSRLRAQLAAMGRSGE